MPEVCWKTGAYCILNRVNGKVYVGGAYVSFHRRLQGHRAALRRRDHYNRHLQAAWDKYGTRAFVFRILERCKPEDVRECEQKWIDFYDAANRKKGYNNSPTAGSSLGVKLSAVGIANMKNAKSYTSPETREKMAAAKRGRIVSVEERNNSSKRMIGNSYGRFLKGKKHTLERRAIQSVAMLGNQNGCGNRGPLSEEHKAKLSAANKGKKLSAETRLKLRKTPEQRLAISESLKGKKQSPETIAKRVQALRGRKRTPEQRQKMSEAALVNSENRRKAAMIRWNIYKED